ncbi:uncharacterized [Tachysurus ichikawai]
MLQVSFSCSALALPDLYSSRGVYHSLHVSDGIAGERRLATSVAVFKHGLPSTAMVRLNCRSIRLIPHISLPIHPINKDPALPLLQSVLGEI